ncbi:MmgE/PrpD family protein [Sciscionella sediminilitoris]|uniref:MmgE/PrpD family protein n=1 Tax=Sciscionella sediminilitoris TaxID=1445613 RepID=UPI00055AD1B9|nr:MmgE/PrpD family protein [Sciscionella sp. SE31]
MSATAKLAEFTTSELRLPELVLPRLRDLVLDYIGISAFASNHAENVLAVRAAVDALDPGDGSATVIGEPRGYRSQYAALLNGCYAHSLDFDDTNHLQVGHPGAPVISAALAEAERTGADGSAFLEALAVGYEVSCRVGAAVGASSYDRGFHLTSTSGIFGAVAAIARLRSFGKETVEHAFGLALSKAAGTMQYLANGAWNKRLHPGFAAHDALVCATLAGAGVRGAADAIDGQYGLLRGYSDDPNPAALIEGLGETWTLLETAIKPYPSCRFTHAAVDAALALRARAPETERAQAEIRIDLSPTAMKIVGEPVAAKLRPQGSVDAQFSVYFQVAAAWLDGKLDWQSYQRIGAADLTAMTDRISTEVGDLSAHETVVTARIHDQEYTESVPLPLGEPDNWIGDAALRGKFTGLAEPVYGADRAGRIVHAVAELGAETDMRTFIASLRA